MGIGASVQLSAASAAEINQVPALTLEALHETHLSITGEELPEALATFFTIRLRASLDLGQNQPGQSAEAGEMIVRLRDLRKGGWHPLHLTGRGTVVDDGIQPLLRRPPPPTFQRVILESCFVLAVGPLISLCFAAIVGTAIAAFEAWSPGDGVRNVSRAGQVLPSIHPVKSPELSSTDMRHCSLACRCSLQSGRSVVLLLHWSVYPICSPSP
jgi:hypothetical protein